MYTIENWTLPNCPNMSGIGLNVDPDSDTFGHIVYY